MAVYRKTPTCSKCGEPSMKAIYKHRGKREMFIGDDFLRWELIKCKCENPQTRILFGGIHVTDL